MPFGLSGAPATFQRLMDRLIGPELEPHVFTYLDDITVVSKTFEEHLKWLEKVLTILQKAGFTVNQEKSHFCCSKVRYLGYKGFPNRGDMILNIPIGLIWTEIFDVCCQLSSVRFAI